MLYFFFLQASYGKRLDDMIKKYGSQLTNFSSIKDQEKSITWALADLSRQVDKIITSDEIKVEISQKFEEIIDRIEIVDKVLENQYFILHQGFSSMKSALGTLMDSARYCIYEDIENLKLEIIDSVQELLDNSPAALEETAEQSKEYLENLFHALKKKNVVRSFLIFLVFQIIFFICIYFHRIIIKKFSVII